ncbi:unnamed protein product [Rotaria socialis]
MLSNQCLYSFDVKWFVRIAMSVPNTDEILSDTCQNLKGSVPTELELSLKEDMYSIRATTIPRMNTSLCVYSYLDKNTMHGLQVIKLESVNVKLIEMSHILINGLDKLSFLTIIGADHFGEIYDKSLRDLQNSNTRSFRTEAPKTIDEDTLFVWL